jgi:hypothetical protein
MLMKIFTLFSIKYIITLCPYNTVTRNHFWSHRSRKFHALKGLSHEIFRVIFWLEWIYLGLKGNCFWFLNFKDVSSIVYIYFKY